MFIRQLLATIKTRLWLAPTLLAFSLPLDAASLDDISFTALPGDKVQIALTLSEPMPDPKRFTTNNPARIALDFQGLTSNISKRSQAVGIGMVRSVRAIEAGNRTRVVINLVDMTSYEGKAQNNQYLITVDAGISGNSNNSRASAPVSRQEPVSNTVAPTAPAENVAAKQVEQIDFRRGDAGEGRVIVRLTDTSTAIDLREEGDQVIIDLLNTDIPENLVRRLDVTDFATPVQSIDTYPTGDNVHMVVSASGAYDTLSYQTDDTFIVEFKPLSAAQKEQLRKDKFTYTGERLSLNFQDIEVRAVLQLLADFTDLNFVTSDTVGGSLTLRLRNVPWDQALDIILKTKGLAMRRTGNVLLVAPSEEIAAREKIELESQKQIEELAPLRSEFIQINYAKASDLATLLKSRENRLLSERGNVTLDDRTNTLLVQDTAERLADVRRLVSKLDIPVRQVLIESRIVVANNDFTRDLGVRFGLTARNNDPNRIDAIGGGLGGNLTSPGPIIENPANSGNEALLVDLPASNPSGAINFLIGSIGENLLRLELSAMQTEGRGEVISSPRIVTSDQAEAIIKQGVEIPFQEATSSGATNIEFKEAVLQLQVTPQITPDDRILMNLTVLQDSPDFSRAIQGVPPVNTREVNTRVLVNNGETIVLGGVYEQTNTQTKEQVPLFGDLPYVGFMFRQSLSTNNNRELLVFVTPKILNDAIPGN